VLAKQIVATGKSFRSAGGEYCTLRRQLSPHELEQLPVSQQRYHALEFIVAFCCVPSRLAKAAHLGHLTARGKRGVRRNATSDGQFGALGRTSVCRPFGAVGEAKIRFMTFV